MPTRFNSTFTRLFILALLLALMSMHTTASAETTELFFSEYIEGSSLNKALEIYNGTGGTIDLAAEGYSIQIYFNGNTSAGTNINLTGTVADGDVYVVADDGADAPILAETDQTSTSNFFNGDDAVVLLKAGVIVDVIGQIGSDPGSQWGSGDASTADNTLRRKSSVMAGDTDGSDAFDPSVEWDGFPQNAFDGLGSHTIDDNGNGAAPVINEFVFNHTGADTHEFAEIFGEADTDYSVYTLLEIEGDTTGSGIIDGVFPIGTTNAGGFWATDFFSDEFENGSLTLLLVADFTGSAGSDLDTDDDGTLDVTPWSAVVDAVAVSDGGTGDNTYAATVLGAFFDGMAFAPGGASLFPDGSSTWVRNDFDGAGLPGFTGSIGPDEAYNTPGAANAVYVPPPVACGDDYTPIYTIQGNDLASPYDGMQVATEGVVVGDFQDGLSGFYLQDVSGDGDLATSDGIFVFYSGSDVNVGETVRVEGTVDEYFNLTEITNVSLVLECGTADLPAPVPLTLPVSSLDDFEPYEGMYVTFPQALYISEYFNFDRFGEIVLTEQRQFQPTAIFEPGSPEAAALADYNRLSRITLDDGRGSQNPDPAYHPNGSEFDLDNLFRGGDQVQNVTGVLDYSFSLYRVQPTMGADYFPQNPRTAEPDDVGGDLTVASFNVLNYFTTFGSRGADDAVEFERQRDKIFAALTEIDADVVGLIEIENNGTAVQDLVSGLNAYLGADVYAYVDTGIIGVDEIAVAYIYKPETVALVGGYAVLDDPSFTNPLGYVDEDGNPDIKTRPALAQTFMDKQTGGVFTAAVNHLKSKGSECGPGDDDPEQGSCNLTRTLGAQFLAEWLATDPTGSGDSDFLIIGDLNAYDKEDPIDALISYGYSDLISGYLGEYAYSYVFDGQLGYLDHSLANPDLQSEVSGVTVWHINADEPDLIDYDMSFKQDAQDAIYAPDAYRSSDHDPVIVGLAVCDEIAPTAEIQLSTYELWPVNHQYVTVTAEVFAADNFDTDPTVTLVSVTSSDPDEDPGNISVNDIVIIDDFTFDLRAERLGGTDGRVYTITYQITDDCGNSTLATATVTVPHDQSP